MDHQEARTEAKLKKYRRISDLIRMRWNFKQDFTEEEVIKVLGILSVNSFCVHDGEEEGTGLIGLYPWTSLMSHSCLPNIKIVTKSDFSYICSAVVNIAQGTEIVTSYHHFYYHLFGTNNRREHIRANWKFDCNCARCQVGLSALMELRECFIAIAIARTQQRVEPLSAESSVGCVRKE